VPILRGAWRGCAPTRALVAVVTIFSGSMTSISYTPRSVPTIAGQDHNAALADALRRSEARYRAYVAQSSEGIWCYETTVPIPVEWTTEQQIEGIVKHGYLADCNDAMARMYGLTSASELIGAPLESLLPLTDRRNREFLRGFIETNYRLRGVESYEQGPDGKPRVIVNNLQGVVEDGCLVRAWGTQTDVTAQKRLEEQVRQSQKMEAVGRLAGGVAHDFNNLLTAILTCSELLLDTLEPDHPGRVDAEEIQGASMRAAELTKQLLLFSRRRSSGHGAPGVLDVNQIVSNADRLLQRLIGEDISLRTELRATQGRVSLDSVSLEQVIVNLAVNARDAMPSGGTLTIETSDLELREPRVHAQVVVPPGAYALLTVSDSGMGMDAAVMAHLFEPFFTTKEKGRGTGLGLATVYGIVAQAGGHVAVYSEPGHGSTFCIYLPRVTDTGDIETLVTDDEAIRGGTETILLVEDEEVVRRLGHRVLTSRGYNVLVARDGQDALRIVQSHAGDINLLLSDVVMPRMSGRELADRLRLRRPNAKILFLSGYTESAIAHRGVLAEGSEFLQKPFTAGVLARRVREVLDQ
jgi:two-component system, cell cycle sensor histidine kinase and response regulator CckA